MALLIGMLHLRIGNGCLAHGAPVDDPGTFVDIAFLIEFEKYFLHRAGTALVHGEPFSFPVRGRTHFLQLIDNLSAVLLFPGPGVFQEFFSADFILVDSLFFQFFNDLYLCGNGGVIRSRLPERLISLHPFETDQDILHGIVQRMAHMQLTRYVWRGHHNGKGFLVRVYFGMEISFVHPVLINPVLHFFRVINLGKFFFHIASYCHSSPGVSRKKSPLHICAKGD